MFLFLSVSSFEQTTNKQDTAKKKNAIVGQDSMSKHNSDKAQERNKKREHKKNIYQDKK